MDEQLEFDGCLYLLKRCDYLMGFKEFVDIHRTAHQTWLEISSRGDVFEMKLVGSHGDGICYRTGASDQFVIFKNTCVLSEESQWNPSLGSKSVFLAEFVNPEYCLLRYSSGPVFLDDLYDPNSDSQICFSSLKFMYRCLSLTSTNAQSGGPVVVNDRERTTCALPVLDWPQVAKKWITRNRKRCWPTQETLDKIIRDGCHCVPVGQSQSPSRHLEWQLCFSVAECTLVHSMNHCLFKFYQILRILIHERLNNYDGCRGVVSSYMIKTLMFWMCEDKLPNFICAGNLRESIHECLTQLEDWIRKDCVPNYFIPERNLIDQNLRPLQKSRILERLLIIKGKVLRELLSCPSFKTVKKEISGDHPQPFDIDVDVGSDYFKSACECVFFSNIRDFSRILLSLALRVLRIFETSYLFENVSDLQSSFLNQIYYGVANAAGKIFHRIVRNLDSNIEKYRFLRLSEAFLKIGCSKDVTSGKLAYATLYFCHGNAKKCILITDAILLKIRPFVVYCRNHGNLANNMSRLKLYQDAILKESIPLFLKMRKGCMTDIEIIRSTFLWPAAINLEMEIYFTEHRVIWVPALVYLYFLRFLCFEMRCDNNLKVEALSNLSVISHDDEHNDKSFLTYNMIGICHTKVKNFSKAVEMFARAAKHAKTLVWMNENMNPGLLRISIVLNITFREIRKYQTRTREMHKS